MDGMLCERPQKGNRIFILIGLLSGGENTLFTREGSGKKEFENGKRPICDFVQVFFLMS